MGILDTISSQCQRKVISLSPICAGWYLVPAFFFDYLPKLDPQAELSASAKADLQFVQGEVKKGLHELGLGPDIGLSVVGRWILAFILVLVSIIVIIHIYYFMKQFGGGGGGTPPSSRFEGMMSGIRRMRGG